MTNTTQQAIVYPKSMLDVKFVARSSTAYMTWRVSTPSVFRQLPDNVDDPSLYQTGLFMLCCMSSLGKLSGPSPFNCICQAHTRATNRKTLPGWTQPVYLLSIVVACCCNRDQGAQRGAPGGAGGQQRAAAGACGGRVLCAMPRCAAGMAVACAGCWNNPRIVVAGIRQHPWLSCNAYLLTNRCVEDSRVCVFGSCLFFEQTPRF